MSEPAALYALTWGQEGDSSSHLEWIFYAMGALFVCGLLLGVWQTVRTRRQREQSEAWLRDEGFTFAGSTLPATLTRPANVWMPEIKISNCWTGTFGGYPVAIFTTDWVHGEIGTVRTVVAVERSPSAAVLMTDFLQKLTTIDSTSTPGWLLASTVGTRRVQVIKALLRALTA